MKEEEKKGLIAILRSEILLNRQLSIIKELLTLYYHSGKYNEDELLECERLAQDKELD